MVKINFLKSEQIKQNVIIRISILVSLLISVPRILSFYDITDQLSETITESSYLDITIRFIAILLFSWFSLQFNTNWRHLVTIKSKFLNVFVILFSNTIITYIGAHLLLYVYPIIVGAAIGNYEAGLFYFIYIVVSFILFFISRVLRYQLIHHQDTIEKDVLKQQNLDFLHA